MGAKAEKDTTERATELYRQKNKRGNIEKWDQLKKIYYTEKTETCVGQKKPNQFSNA